MFERFTDRARRVIVLAQEEVRILNHSYIGTEHILLGLLREEEGIAAHLLESLEITVERVRAQVARIVGSGEGLTSSQIPFTPEAKRALELSLREALALGHNYIATEHILLGLVKAGEGVATQVLLELDADPEKIRREVIQVLPSREGRQWARGRAVRAVGGPVPTGTSGFRDPLIEGVTWLIETVAAEVEGQLGRTPDVGDLLLTLACLADGLAPPTLSRLDVDADRLQRAVEEARREEVLPSSLAPPELVAEIERVRSEKEAKLEAQQFEQAASLRDKERRLVGEARDQEARALEEILVEVRARLALASG